MRRKRSGREIMRAVMMMAVVCIGGLASWLGYLAGWLGYLAGW